VKRHILKLEKFDEQKLILSMEVNGFFFYMSSKTSV